VEAIEGAEAAVAVHLVLIDIGEGQLLPIFLKSLPAVKPLGQLAHLLPKLHPGDQVLRPQLRGYIFILIREHKRSSFYQKR